jgi:hypothetical protein
MTLKCYAYGFSKIEHGPGQGSYVHPNFQRNNQAISLTIQRHLSPASRLHCHHQCSLSPTSRESSPKTKKIITQVARPAIKSTRNYKSSCPVPFPSQPQPSTIVGTIDSASSNLTSAEVKSLLTNTQNLCVILEEQPRPLCSCFPVNEALDPFLGMLDDLFVLEPRPINIMLRQSCQNDVSSDFFRTKNHHEESIWHHSPIH